MFAKTSAEAKYKLLMTKNIVFMHESYVHEKDISRHILHIIPKFCIIIIVLLVSFCSMRLYIREDYTVQPVLG